MDNTYQTTLSMDQRQPWDSEEQLNEWYVEQGMNLREISNKVDVSTTTVARRMSEAGIPRRGGGVRTAQSTFRTNVDGYEEVSGTHQTVPLHRLIAVAEWGFENVKNREVHHLNGCTFHNTLSNLQLCHPSEHTKLHHRKKHFKEGQSELSDFK
jgi:hypothetical protein